MVRPGKKIINRDRLMDCRGISLTELVVASVLVGIMILGIFSIDYAIRGSRNTASDDAVLAMQTWATMTYITNDAKQAVGDASDSGVIVDGAGQQWVCFRLDRALTPDDYTDDSWNCYAQNGNDIRRCQYADASFPGVPACAGTDLLVGTFATDAACPAANCFRTTIAFAPNSGQMHVDIYLKNRLQPTVAMDPLTNPDYTLQTRVYPEGHSY